MGLVEKNERRSQKASASLNLRPKAHSPVHQPQTTRLSRSLKTIFNSCLPFKGTETLWQNDPKRQFPVKSYAPKFSTHVIKPPTRSSHWEEKPHHDHDAVGISGLHLRLWPSQCYLLYHLEAWEPLVWKRIFIYLHFLAILLINSAFSCWIGARWGFRTQVTM